MKISTQKWEKQKKITNIELYTRLGMSLFNTSSANPTKWSNTVKQFVGKLVTNCLSVFDHFVGLALKGLI